MKIILTCQLGILCRLTGTLFSDVTLTVFKALRAHLTLVCVAGISL